MRPRVLCRGRDGPWAHAKTHDGALALALAAEWIATLVATILALWAYFGS